MLGPGDYPCRYSLQLALNFRYRPLFALHVASSANDMLSTLHLPSAVS